MKVLLVLTCLLAACLAQTPCESPERMTGQLTVSTQNEKLWVYAKFIYDAVDQKIRINEFEKHVNTSFSKDFLLIYKESTIYDINKKDKTCEKLPLKDTFHPFEVPKDATLLAQVTIGSSSKPEQGVLVDSWTGDLPGKRGQYSMTVTEYGCYPVSFAAKTKHFGWMLFSYFNNSMGIPDPGQLIPPDFCKSAEMKSIEPLDFFGLFH